MSALRHRFRIVLDGRTLEIVTSARDLAAIDVDENTNGAEQAFRMCHAACIRLGISGVPTGWEQFTDLLDDLEDLEPETVVNENPMRATVSAIWLLLSLSLPALLPVNGSMSHALYTAAEIIEERHERERRRR